MTRAYIGLGSNVGDSRGIIQGAATLLSEVGGIHELELSSIYRTEPIGEIEQAWFLNAVARVETTLLPEVLLEECRSVEEVYLRERKVRWGPRTLDLDILVFGGLEVDLPDLKVPHPRMLERAFVLAPLLELWPEGQVGGKLLRDCLIQCGDQSIEKLSGSIG